MIMRVHRRQRFMIATLGVLLVGGILIFAIAPKVALEQEVKALGISLLTAGIVSLLLDRLAFAALIGEMNDTLSSAVGAFALIQNGLRSISTGPFYPEVYEELKDSKTFTIVQTWSPDLTNLLREASKVVKERGGLVRVYLLHPESRYARQRGVDLGPGPDLVPGKIRSDTSDLRARYAKLQEENTQGRLELYYYDALPAFALYAVDKRAWVCTYWYAAQSDAGPTIRLEIPSPAWAHYQQHLEELHRKSVQVPLDRVEEPPLQDQLGVGNG